VFLDIYYSMLGAQSLSRFTLYHLYYYIFYPVDEVSSFQRPSWWDLVSFDLYLFAQNLVSDLLSIPTVVRSSP